MVSEEDDGQEAEAVLLGASVLVLPVWKGSKLRDLPSIVLTSSSCHQLLYVEVQHMFTLICMPYLCVSVIHRTVT